MKLLTGHHCTRCIGSRAAAILTLKVGAAMAMLCGLCPMVLGDYVDLPGQYNGYYRKPGYMQDTWLGMRLEIASAENGLVKATAYRVTRHHNCGGVYHLEGNLRDGFLMLASIGSNGRVPDCVMRLRLAVNGDKLDGTLNRTELHLSKRQ